MRTTVSLCSAARRLIALLLACAAATDAAAAALEVTVVDEHGKPIPNVAVYATPVDGGHDAPAHAAVAASADAESVPTAVMDQQNLQFAPHLLVVQAGTSVAFPNGDHVSHHVYSFSETKKLELPLYKGDVYPPVLFDQSGIVVLGCNIHDGMLGYIVVVDTPHFAKTNGQGVALLDGMPGGDFVVATWTPRVRPSGLPDAQQLTVAGEGTTAAKVEIRGRLSPAHPHGTSSLTWERY